MKLKLQIGVESYTGSERTVRLTPVEQKFDVPDQVGSILKMVFALADGADKQAGDGDVDFPIGKVSNILKNPRLAFAAKAVEGFDGDANVFLRLADVKQ